MACEYVITFLMKRKTSNLLELIFRKNWRRKRLNMLRR